MSKYKNIYSEPVNSFDIRRYFHKIQNTSFVSYPEKNIFYFILNYFN
jgi:hypothetical protein